jgi:hypothetical protein
VSNTLDYRLGGLLKNKLVFVIFVIAAASANGATTCPTGPLSPYLVGGFTCQTDGSIFSDFGYEIPPGGVPASAIQVVPLSGPGFAGFQFNGSFTASQEQTITYLFGYFVDPPPIIHGEQIDLDPFGDVSLQTDLCITLFPCAPADSLGTLNATTGNTMASTQFPNTGTLAVQSTLTLTGGNTGATSQGFDNVTFTTPEASSMLLAASGLFALLAFRWRAKLRKIRLQ